MAEQFQAGRQEPDDVERLQQQLGPLDRRQIATWRKMTPAERLEIAFQAYQFALDFVRVTERRRHPDLTEEQLARRVVERMQGRRLRRGESRA